MWPFKRKHKPKVLIDSLKKSYEKIDFEDESKMGKLYTYFLSVEAAFKKNRDGLNKQIEVVMDKAEKHVLSEEVLKKIEQDSANELIDLKDKEDTRENRDRTRKLTAALHSSQFKLSMFSREMRDYTNTEKLLCSLYQDLEDCSNMLEYMIGSLDRNLERVRAASFFTLSLEATPECLELTDGKTTTTLSHVGASGRHFEVFQPAPSKFGIKRVKPWPESSDPPKALPKGYPDTFEGRLEKLQDKLDAKAKEVQDFRCLTFIKENSPGGLYVDSWSHIIYQDHKKDVFNYTVQHSPSYGGTSYYTLMGLYKENKEVLLEAVKTIDEFSEKIDKVTEEKAKKEVDDERLLKEAMAASMTVSGTQHVDTTHAPAADSNKIYDLSGVEFATLEERKKDE